MDKKSTLSPCHATNNAELISAKADVPSSTLENRKRVRTASESLPLPPPLQRQVAISGVFQCRSVRVINLDAPALPLPERFDAAVNSLNAALDDPGPEPDRRNALLRALRNSRDDRALLALFIERLDMHLEHGSFEQRLGRWGPSTARALANCLWLGAMDGPRDLQVTPMAIGLVKGVLDLLARPVEPSARKRIPDALTGDNRLSAADLKRLIELLERGIVVPGRAEAVSLVDIAERALRSAVDSLCAYIGETGMPELLLLRAILRDAAMGGKKAIEYRLDRETQEAVKKKMTQSPENPAGAVDVPATAEDVQCICSVVPIAMKMQWPLARLIDCLRQAMAGAGDGGQRAALKAEFFRRSDFAERAVRLSTIPRPKMNRDELYDSVEMLIESVEMLIEHVGAGLRREDIRQHYLARLHELIQDEPADRPLAYLDLSYKLYGAGD